MNIFLVYTLAVVSKLGVVRAAEPEEPSTRGGWSSSKSTKSSKSWWSSSTDHPTLFPTLAPTLFPTLAPTLFPTFAPTYCWGKSSKSGKSGSSWSRRLQEGAVKDGGVERGSWSSKSSKSWYSCHSSKSWWRGSGGGGYKILHRDAPRVGDNGGKSDGDNGGKGTRRELDQKHEPAFKPGGMKVRRRRINGRMQ